MDIPFFKLGDDGPSDGCYFGTQTSPEESSLVLISAPWGVTSACGEGAAYAPDALIEASKKIGLYDFAFEKSFEGVIATADIDYDIQERSQQLGSDAERVLSHIADGGTVSGEYFTRKVTRINEGFGYLHESIYRQSLDWLGKGKKIGIVGGDHSVGFGAVKAVGESVGDFGVLYFDAHCDVGEDKSVFDYSDRSIVRNLLGEVPQISRFVMVGTRNGSADEVDFLKREERVRLFPAPLLAEASCTGSTWHEICEKIVAELPEKVYISFDIDALTIENCPHTTTPEAGGLSFDRTVCLINAVVRSGRKIVGFDLVEIVPKLESSIDAVVGARMLAKLCAATLFNK